MWDVLIALSYHNQLRQLESLIGPLPTSGTVASSCEMSTSAVVSCALPLFESFCLGHKWCNQCGAVASLLPLLPSLSGYAVIHDALEKQIRKRKRKKVRVQKKSDFLRKLNVKILRACRRDCVKCILFMICLPLDWRLLDILFLTTEWNSV